MHEVLLYFDLKIAFVITTNYGVLIIFITREI